MLFILFYLCIKFKIQTHYSLDIKKEISDKFMSLDLSKILFFFYFSLVTINLSYKIYT
jgi:hypothetical protein